MIPEFFGGPPPLGGRAYAPFPEYRLRDSLAKCDSLPISGSKSKKWQLPLPLLRYCRLHPATMLGGSPAASLGSHTSMFPTTAS